MTRPRILFRADASHERGFGHVARLCALIEEVEARGGEPIALFGGDATSVAAWARDRKIEVLIKDWSPSEILREASDPRVTAVVIDGPELASALVPRLDELGTRTVLIDDNGGCALAANTVVNHNYHATVLAGTYANARQHLLGRRYLMLRRDIRRHTRGACRPGPARRLRVVLSFGGSDPVGATVRVIGLVPATRPLELVVITGPGFRDHAMLAAAAELARAAGHVVEIRRAPEDPGALFVSADAAICSAGGTLGELAYLGCPALAIAIVPDQVVPARHQLRDGLIAGGLGWAEPDDVVRHSIEAFLGDDTSRAELRQRALATADSDGARRIIDEALAS